MRSKRTIIVLFAFALCVGGCESGLWTSVAGGVAGSETIDSWETNLELKQAELAAREKAAIARLADANTPEEKEAVRADLAEINNQIIANQASLFALQNVKSIPEFKKKDPVAKAEYLIGLLPVIWGIYERTKKKRVEAKYSAFKIGKEIFDAEAEPKVARDLHRIIGIERRKANV